jgi:hypothetical protein
MRERAKRSPIEKIYARDFAETWQDLEEACAKEKPSGLRRKACDT